MKINKLIHKLLLIASLVTFFVTTSYCKVFGGSNKADMASRNPADTTGKRIFTNICASCHTGSIQSLAPGLSVMSNMSPRAIFASLNTGKMRQQGAALSEDERRKVAKYITKTVLKNTVLPKEAYTPFSMVKNKPLTDHSGWGNNLEGTGFRSTAQAGISLKNVATLKLKWAFAFPDGTIIHSKPAVAGEWLIVGSQFGNVYAINKNSGKIGWEFAASAPVRGAISIIKKGTGMMAVFSDYSTNVYALDIATGKLLWNKRTGYEPQSANTGSVVSYNGKIFVPITSAEVSAAGANAYDCCSSSGGVVALNAATGNIIWTYRIIAKAIPTGKKKNGKPFFGPSGAPVWCSPTIDTKRGLLYIGTGQNYSEPFTKTSDALQAINMQTGKLVWNFQATGNDTYSSACPLNVNCPETQGQDLDFGMAPILVKGPNNQDILLAGQKSGVVFALTPGGKLIWKSRIGKGGKLGGIHWGMATDGKYVYAANADNYYALDITDTVQKPAPGIYALSLKTGKIIWNTASPACADGKFCLPFNSAAPLVIPGIVFAGSLNGHIRAYASSSGKILWDFDIIQEYETTSGLKGKGGAIDGPAPVVAGGMLFVNSGYGMFGETPGNVLLAFETEKLK
ncbi:PQQ-binding-like beta-propeller repeat protein [Mucilaginibacter terrae]|uniref:outer membrane protein assembly factor BamB family protein n=1 Tax=Mucilaginibacter terrae TaxID=1955052 RepID=UPI0036438F05